MLRPGDIVADTYVVTGVLGTGGMSEVYDAVEPALDRQVAIKVATDAGTARLLRAEGQALAAIHHRGLPQIHRLGADRGQRFLALERLAGRTLDEDLARRGRFAIDEAVAIGLQLAEVLAAVHRAGMAHRDLKPGNVMLCRSRVVLLDFGIAIPEIDRPLTQLSVGTPRYIAPEAIQAAVPLGQAYQLDVYALGATLFELIAGRPPFDAGALLILLDLHLHAPIPALSFDRPEVPAALDGLVTACLAKDPGDRPAAMDEIASELRGIQRTISASHTPHDAGRMRALVPR